MRRFLLLLLCLAALCSLCVTAYAATGISGGSYSATVSSDGSCQVNLDLVLHLEGDAPDLIFPLPSSARSVTLNGKPALGSRSGDVLNIRLSSVVGNVSGDFSVRLQYTLPKVVDYNDSGKLILTLPVLSGFGYPITALDFSIQLPGEPQRRPDFTSGYYQKVIESSLTHSVTGSTVTGSVIEPLKDRETLTMVLEVTEEMFPQDPIAQWTVGLEEILMSVVAGLALVYWIFFLRCAPFLSRRSPVPPEGYTAGELAGLLAGRGYDLNMMVFSWAQLGYILIHVKRGGRVLLYKQMDMGNERGIEEVRLFNKLFGKRNSVEGTGAQYASLSRRVAADTEQVRDLYRRTTGNPRIFRLLCAFIGLLSGISLGRALAGDAVLGVLLIAILAVAGGLSAWIMHNWVWGLHLNDRFSFWLGLGLAGVWCLLGIPAKIVNVTACTAAAQLLCGLATAYGGRRTVMGRLNLSQMLGLRKFLKRMTPEEAERVSRSDPDYFFNMAPYALALGVLQPFARSFHGMKLDRCAYLMSDTKGNKNAEDWAVLMEEAVFRLNSRRRTLLLERLTGKR